MLSKIISAPLLIAVAIILYLTWEFDRNYALYIIPFVVLLSLNYIMSPQINWWWYQKHPPQLDSRIRFIIEKHSAFYQSLSEEDQKKFRDRVALYMEANEFIAKGMEGVPEDVKGVIGANVAHLTFYREDFLLPKFEHIIIYPQPFPSPQYLEHWHTAEIHVEDGVVLLSAEHLMKAFLQPERFYNICLHSYANAFMISYPEYDYPELGEEIWSTLEQVTGFSKEFVTACIGLPDISPLPVSIVAYLMNPTKFQKLLPNLFLQYQQIFQER